MANIKAYEDGSEVPEGFDLATSQEVIAITSKIAFHDVRDALTVSMVVATLPIKFMMTTYFIKLTKRSFN